MAMSLDTDRVLLTPIRSVRPPLKDMHDNYTENYEDLR